MSSIPPKWIEFANKYLALAEGSKSAWFGKLSQKQQEYLKIVLDQLTAKTPVRILPSKSTQHFDFKPSALTQNTTIGDQAVTKPKIETPQTQSITVEFPTSQLKNPIYPQFLANTDQAQPKTLNLSMIMPAPKFDLGIASMSKNPLNQPQAAHFGNQQNLTKSQYIRNKAGIMVKNTIVQAVLIGLVLALPIAGVVFALNNSGSIQAFGSGKKTLPQVFAEPNSTNFGVTDLEFMAWIADFSGLTEAQRTTTSDPDQDGLNNLEEFKFQTIPTNSFTCNNKKLDGENILAQIDPLSCKPINFNDPSVAAKFDGVVSRTKINYRLSLVALDNFLNPKSAQPTISTVPPDSNTQDLDIDYGQNALLQIKGVDPAFKSDHKYEVAWMQSTDSNQLLDRVDQQIVSYPTGAIPGKPGNIYLSGKGLIKADSSDTAILAANIFTKLDRLEPGDQLIFSLKTKDGQTKTFIYKVRSQNLHLASDPNQFKTTKLGNSELTLATPWTDSGSDQRLVIKGILEKS